MMKHKNVPAHEMDKAKEVLIKVGATKERIVFIALYYRQLFAERKKNIVTVLLARRVQWPGLTKLLEIF